MKINKSASESLIALIESMSDKNNHSSNKGDESVLGVDKGKESDVKYKKRRKLLRSLSDCSVLESIKIVKYFGFKQKEYIENIFIQISGLYLSSVSSPFNMFSELSESLHGVRGFNFTTAQEEASILSVSLVHLQAILKETDGKLILLESPIENHFFSDSHYLSSLEKIFSQYFEVQSVFVFQDVIKGYALLRSTHQTDINFDEYCLHVLEALPQERPCHILNLDSFINPNKLHKTKLLDFLEVTQRVAFETLETVQENSNKYQSFLPSIDDMLHSQHYRLIQKYLKHKNTTLIVIGSMPRSGSTWLFNCLREIFKVRSSDFYSAWVEDYDMANPSPYHIVKCHTPDVGLTHMADFVLSTRRDVRNSVTSLIRMGWLDNDKESIMRNIHNVISVLHPYWEKCSDLEIEYEDIIHNGVSVVQSIADTIRQKLNQNEIEEINKKLSKLSSKSVFNKETQLHPNHRALNKTDFTNALSEEVINEINSVHASWLKSYGYLEKSK
tara:strand:- start:288 stop:1787 length:1500 start_codon:yes stop_codon:yes gene_type:complete